MKTPIFARARLSGPPLQLGVPSPADLAAAVRKPAAPQATQAALYELHERRSALLEETRQLSTVIFTEKGADGGRAMRRAAQLGGEIKELDQRIAEATARARRRAPASSRTGSEHPCAAPRFGNRKRGRRARAAAGVAGADRRRQPRNPASRRHRSEISADLSQCRRSAARADPSAAVISAHTFQLRRAPLTRSQTRGWPARSPDGRAGLFTGFDRHDYCSPNKARLDRLLHEIGLARSGPH
jgi:hypothetical protein